MPRLITRKELLRRFKKAHGRFYDYSNVVYSRMWDKVEIGCPLHGKFLQAPMNHINGMGCGKCGKNHGGPTAALTTEDFIRKSKSSFGTSAFDYSEVEYKNSRESVVLRCRKHNHKFKIKVNTHLSRSVGCPICGRNSGRLKLRDAFKKFKTFVDFKCEANRIHGERYTYKPFTYLNGKQQFELKCPQHGWFKQRTFNHLNGRGCGKCATLVTSEKLKMSTEDFLKAARQIHGDVYDYHKAKYKSFHSKLIIICQEHGQFRQTTASHLSGNGCIKCGFAKVRAENTMPQKEFIRRAKEIHGRKYDYSKMLYKNAQSAVAVICKKHGIFNQHAGAHLKGSGCPNCQRSKGEDAIAALLRKHKIKFIPQWRKHNCRDKGVLSFDFYLPKYNAIIEFDGIQHFFPVSFGGSQSEAEVMSNFERIQIRDVVKKKWAKKNKILFFRIKYNDDLARTFKRIKSKLSA